MEHVRSNQIFRMSGWIIVQLDWFMPSKWSGWSISFDKMIILNGHIYNYSQFYQLTACAIWKVIFPRFSDIVAEVKSVLQKLKTKIRHFLLEIFVNKGHHQFLNELSCMVQLMGLAVIVFASHLPERTLYLQFLTLNQCLKLKFSISHPEMFTKFPSLYNLL